MIGFLRRGCAALLGVALLAAAASAAEPVRATVTPIDATQFRAVLDQHRGQVVLVNFWATWCRPCLKEIPDLMALADKHRAEGLQLVAVSLDEPGDLQGVVLPFLEKWFPKFRTYARLTPGMDGMVSVVDPAWNELLPTSYVIDRAGKVRARIQGGKSGAEFEAAVVPVLSE
jgi:thiol-disulfide isomerase/thioredoxin